MRLKSLTATGFRGFSEEVTLDLDADAVIVSGVNGTGKTSMFDAILWALTGSIERLHASPADLINKYSPSGEARVQLVLERIDRAPVIIVRRFDGDTHLSVDGGESEQAVGAAAESLLVDLVWADAKTAAEPGEALSRSLTRAMYLQQDLVREFIDADSEQDRFRVVGELVGVGRVTELQRQLETSRTAWSRATNNLAKDIEPLQTQKAALEDRIRRLAGEKATGSVSEDAFQLWLTDAREFLSPEDMSRLSSQPAQSLDKVLPTLQERRRREERRTASLQRLLDHLRSPAPATVEMEPVHAAIQAHEAAIAEASERLRLAEEAAAAERRSQAELRNQRESLRTLAQLAIRHLNERCPVCAQTYDRAATLERLQQLIQEAHDEPESQSSAVSISDAAAALESAQRALSASQAELRSAQQAQQGYEAWHQAADQLARDSALEVSDNVESTAEQQLASSRAAITSLDRLVRAAEGISLQFARTAELAQRTEAENQLAILLHDISARESEHEARVRTGELANDVLTALRRASGSIVQTELSRIEPLLQRIYATVDPHPSFRAVRFLTTSTRGHGNLWTSLDDVAEGVTVREPSVVLSSSQLNVLAVSTFLSLNLAMDTLPLQVVALDDPLQSLDTVNLLGLADLLRRVKRSRQVIVSTHDGRLAELLARKLRPVSTADRTCTIKFDAWTRSGPDIIQDDLRPDLTPIKLAASA
jgi:DNA repair exonuclease SbcCD ATPase subunit